MRAFRPIKGWNPPLTVRKTKDSAGYDLCAAQPGAIPSGKMAVIPTGTKVYMEAGEYLAIHIRSSLAFKHGLSMVNGTGIIDCDYVDNPDNEGHIMLGIVNNSDKDFSYEAGDRIAQGIFCKYLTTDDDKAHERRVGGIGSTGR